LRHLECLKVPLKYLFAGGTLAKEFSGDFQLAQTLGYRLVQAKAEKVNCRILVEDELGKYGVRFEERRGLVLLD